MIFPALRGPLVWGLVLAGVVLVVVTQPAGLWWMGMAAGLVLGLLVRGRLAALGALLVGALGWGLPLLWEARTQPVGAVAGVLGGLLGVPTAAAFGVTLLVGVLLTVAGAWVGIALRRLVSRPPHPGEVTEPPPNSTSEGS